MVNAINPITQARLPTETTLHKPQDNYASTISPSTQEPPFVPSKPKLCAPELLIMQRGQRTKQLSKKVLGIGLNKMELENRKVEKFTLEQLGAEHAKIKADEQAYIWDFLRDLSSYLLASFTIALGISSAGTAAGPLLIASGTLTLISNMISQFGGWEWLAEMLASENKERQANIAMILPMLVTMISIACSLTGMMNLAEIQTAEQILGHLDRAIQFIKGGSECGSAYGAYKQGSAEGRTIEVNQVLNLSEKKVDLMTRAFEELMKEYNRVSSTVSKMIKRSMYESRAVTQG